MEEAYRVVSSMALGGFTPATFTSVHKEAFVASVSQLTGIEPANVMVLEVAANTHFIIRQRWRRKLPDEDNRMRGIGLKVRRLEAGGAGLKAGGAGSDGLKIDYGGGVTIDYDSSGSVADAGSGGVTGAAVSSGGLASGLSVDVPMFLSLMPTAMPTDAPTNAPTDAPSHAPTKAPTNMLSGSGSGSTHNPDGSGSGSTHNPDGSETTVSDGGKTIESTAVDGTVTLTHANDDGTISTTTMNALTDVPMDASSIESSIESSIDGAPMNRAAAGVTPASHAGGDEYTASNDDRRVVSSDAASGDGEVTAEHVDDGQSDGVTIKYEIDCTGNEIKISEVGPVR
jgi:hypothetical protein